MAKIWKNTGGKIIKSGGDIVVCSDCPCLCEQCSAEGGGIDLEFASVVDNGDCTFCDASMGEPFHLNNTTFTLTGGGSGCEWLGGGPCSLTFDVIFLAGRIVCFVMAPGEIAEFELAGAAPWDCTATHTLTFVDSTGDACDFTGATITLNPP